MMSIFEKEDKNNPGRFVGWLAMFKDMATLVSYLIPDSEQINYL